MYFAPPIDYDKIMKLIPYGKIITVREIREHFAKLPSVDKGTRPKRRRLGSEGVQMMKPLIGAP